MVRRQLSDAERLDAARSGDRNALGDLLTEHYDNVFAVCLQMMRDRAAAEDCAQEAMIRIARGLGGFDGRSALSTWCHRVAVTTSLDAIRRERRRPLTVTTNQDGQPPVDPVDASAEAAITATAEGGELRQMVAAALAAMPGEFARAVVMRDVADLDYAEIAEIERVAIGTVKSRISRGRSMLNDLLGGNRTGVDGRPTHMGSSDGPS
ncbi:MAG: RNA polymerase sigma factor [Ilumatobacteraceae bacterium]